MQVEDTRLKISVISVSTGSVTTRRVPRPLGVMDPDFRAELVAEGLHADLARWMLASCGTPARFAKFIDSLRAESQDHILDQIPAEDRWAPWDFLLEYRVGSEPALQQVRMAYKSTRRMWNEAVRLEGLSLGATVIRSGLEADPFWPWVGAEVDDRSLARDSVRADTPPLGSKGRARDRSRSLAISSGTVAPSTSKGKPFSSRLEPKGRPWTASRRGCTSAARCWQ